MIHLPSVHSVLLPSMCVTFLLPIECVNTFEWMDSLCPFKELPVYSYNGWSGSHFGTNLHNSKICAWKNLSLNMFRLFLWRMCECSICAWYTFIRSGTFISIILNTTLQLALHAFLCICYLHEILKTDRNIWKVNECIVPTCFSIVMWYLQWTREHWYNYTVTLSIRLLLYLAITSVYTTSHIPHIPDVVVPQNGLCCVQYISANLVHCE